MLIPPSHALLSTASHALEWAGQAGDPSWAGVPGAPTAPITLDVIDVTHQGDWDRVPSTRLTVTCHPPAAGVRWLCPLHRTAWVRLWAIYTPLGGGAEEVGLGDFQLRRRRLDWPDDGAVTLDVATWDGDYAERMQMAADTAPPGGDA